MITGVFRDEHPRVELTIGEGDFKTTIEFIVDTGFAGDLTLPRSVAQQANLPFLAWRLRRLATGEDRRLAVHLATIEWNSEDQQAEVLIMEGEPLLGTGLLLGMLLTVEATEGGDVSIEPLE